jgi:acyl-CoA synthetase (AMP-forming)/AMP-acid ligase II
VSSDELLAAAAKVLARYELPEELRVVDALPRTPSGKVDLAALRDLFTVEP